MTPRWLVFVLAMAAFALMGNKSCTPDDDDPADGTVSDTVDATDTADAVDVAEVADAADTTDDTTPTLTWWMTCGDPVCMGHTPNPAIPECTTETVGAACTVAGELCDPINDCNAKLVCADSDPKDQPGGCPISLREKKRDIRYLDDADRQAALEALRTMPLSTWRYRHDDPTRTPRLGFVIEDLPPDGAARAAVDADRGMVDLYGYTSMAVAALQAQAEELKALRAEMETLRASCQAPGAGVR